ncbi:MAG: hypothetical protein GYB65_03770 [Chloroflexi bacterium]|nr:hypothetical protein [Chloroflexota bacterium]
MTSRLYPKSGAREARLETRREIFIARPMAEADNIIDADLEEANPFGPWKDYRHQNSPPPPSHIPARPGYAAEEDFAPGDDPYEDDVFNAMRHFAQRLLKELGYFVFVTRSPNGSIFGAFHLPVRVIAMLIFTLFLVFVTLYNFPSIWETVFSFFGLA